MDHPEFKADGFFQDCGGKAQKGHLKPLIDGLYWKTDTQERKILFNEIVLDFAGSEGNHAVVKLPADDGTEFYVEDGIAFMKVLTEVMPVTTTGPSPAELLHTRITRKTSSFALQTGIIIAAILFIFIASKGIEIVEGWIVRVIPISADVTLGKLVTPQTLACTPITDEKVNALLSDATIRLYDSLLSKNKELEEMELELIIIKESSVNAFAAPGGKVFVTTGLIAFTQSQDELAGVIAHELIHQSRRHVMANLVNTLKWQLMLSLLIGDLSGIEELVVSNSKYMLQMNYSREHEFEADTEGLRLMARAGHSPEKMPEFFERLAKEEHILVSSLDFLSTHPASHKRAEILRKIIQSENLSAGKTAGFSVENAETLLAEEPRSMIHYDDKNLHFSDNEWKSFQALVKRASKGK